MSLTESQALNLFRKGNHSELVNLIQTHGLTCQSSPSILKIVAGSYLILGDFSRTIEIAEELYPLYVNDIEFLSLYGAAARRNSDFNKQAMFKAVFELDQLIFL